MKKRWIEEKIAEHIGAKRAMLSEDEQRLIVEAGTTPLGWLADLAEPGDILDLPTNQWARPLLVINGKTFDVDDIERLTSLVERTVYDAGYAVSRLLSDQIPGAVYAAQRLALWAGHGWAWGLSDDPQERRLYSPDGEYCDWCVTYDAVEMVASTYADVFYDVGGPGAGKAIQALIRNLYHMFGVEGPVGWGVEHPTVLDDGTIVVSIGYHGQLEGRFTPAGEWTITASGPGGRYVTIDAHTGAVVEARDDAQPRDYARARAAVEQVRAYWRWYARRGEDADAYVRRAVMEAASEYGLEGDSEYARYARLAHNPGHLLAGKGHYEDEEGDGENGNR